MKPVVTYPPLGVSAVIDDDQGDYAGVTYQGSDGKLRGCLCTKDYALQLVAESRRRRWAHAAHRRRFNKMRVAFFHGGLQRRHRATVRARMIDRRLLRGPRARGAGRPGSPRRAAASSTSSSADPGSGSDPDSEQPPAGRRLTRYTYGVLPPEARS